MNLSLNTEEFVGLISWFNIYPATRLPSEGVQSNPAEGVQSQIRIVLFFHSTILIITHLGCLK